MDMTLTINMKNAAELQKFLMILSDFEALKSNSAEAPMVDVVAEPENKPLKAARGPGRPPKVENKSELKAETKEPAKPDTSELKKAVEATSEVIKAAPRPVDLREKVMLSLKKVNDTLGLPKAREILQNYGAQRISDIPADEYQNFINTCELALT